MTKSKPNLMEWFALTSSSIHLNTTTDTKKKNVIMTQSKEKIRNSNSKFSNMIH